MTAIVQLFAPGWTVKTPHVTHNDAKRNFVHVVVTTLLLGSGLLVASNVDDLGATQVPLTVHVLLFCCKSWSVRVKRCWLWSLGVL